MLDSKKFNRFTQPLETEHDHIASMKHGKEMHKVLRAFSFYVGERENNEWVYIPEGFLTDGASVPKWLHWVIPPWGKHGQAAVVHDMLCQIPVLHTPDGMVQINDSRVNDIFKEALVVSGNGRIKVFAMYWAVKAYFLFRKESVAPEVLKHNLLAHGRMMADQKFKWHKGRP